MSKRQIVKEYLQDVTNWYELQKDYKNSWIEGKLYLLPTNGLVSKHISYNTICDAIQMAEYKYQDSDRTWMTVHEVIKELIYENIN